MSNVVEVDEGDSSRSASPASDDIDFDDNQQRQQQQDQLLHSPISPQRTTLVTHTDKGRTAGSSRQAPSRGGHGQTTKRRAGGAARQDIQYNDNHGGGSRGMVSNGGLMDPAQASAFDKLLDLNFPRDFGDPVARFDAAMKRTEAAQLHPPVDAPGTSTNAQTSTSNSAPSA